LGAAVSPLCQVVYGEENPVTVKGLTGSAQNNKQDSHQANHLPKLNK
jgi:hypothetical protein